MIGCGCCCVVWCGAWLLFTLKVAFFVKSKSSARSIALAISPSPFKIPALIVSPHLTSIMSVSGPILGGEKGKKSRTFWVTFPIASVTLLIAPLMRSAILVTMFFPAFLKLENIFLIIFNAPRIPFRTAFLTPLNAFDTIPRSELNMFLMVFLMALTTVEIVFLMPFQTLVTTLRTAFITVEIMFLIKLKPALTTFLAVFTPLVNRDFTAFHKLETMDRKPVNNALPAFKIFPTNHSWMKFHTNRTAPLTICLIEPHKADQFPVNNAEKN